MSAPEPTARATAERATTRAPRHVVRWAFAGTSLGRIAVAATERGICLVAFADSDAELLAEVAARFPRAEVEPADARTQEWACTVAAVVENPASADAATPPLDTSGTDFQRLVWTALREIPAGTTVTYSQLAETIGRPAAVRAVASACGANPLAVLVPCHRVIGADGSLRGYRWGIERKRALLDRERST